MSMILAIFIVVIIPKIWCFEVVFLYVCKPLHFSPEQTRRVTNMAYLKNVSLTPMCTTVLKFKQLNYYLVPKCIISSIRGLSLLYEGTI